MIEIVFYEPEVKSDKLDAILTRNSDFDPKIEATVLEIVSEVRRRGDEALLEFTGKFDGVSFLPEELRVSEAEIEAAYGSADPALIESLQAAEANIRRFHGAQKRTSWFLEDGDGVMLGKRVVSLHRVGLLVPGGSAPLISTLLMAAIPSQIAGVPQICVVTPPRTDGSVHPGLLAAARILGVLEIYKVFGAQAVAALAYGTGSIPKVDKIVGPGNLYVQIAKKRVYGDVGIDMIAGPSEIVVLADGSANPRWVAADLLSQAEHGSGFEVSICITPSETLANRVQEEVIRQIGRLPRVETITRAMENFGAIVIVPDLGSGIDLINRIAPEHVELQVDHPWEWMDRIEHAGAVFLGSASSEPVGDYFAGTNHILPTMGAARFASSLGVEDFLKTISLVAYTQQRLEKTKDHILCLAQAEGLDAHAEAIKARFRPDA